MHHSIFKPFESYIRVTPIMFRFHLRHLLVFIYSTAVAHAAVCRYEVEHVKYGE